MIPACGVTVLLCAALLASPPPATGRTPMPKTLAAQLNVLETSTDRGALEDAGRSVASSGDRAALQRLGALLSRADVLARLDNVADRATSTYHLGRVLGAVESHPSAATASLCLQLLSAPDFQADPDRITPVLPALIAVRPMSAAAAEAVRQANAQGYSSLTMPLLVRNGSPRALALFESIVLDRSRDAESRIADIHAAVLPRRTDPDVLRAIDRLLETPHLEDPIATALIETVFDYQSRRWFGPARNPPTPPPWKGAPPVVANLIRSIGEKAKARKSLPPALSAAIDATTGELRATRSR